MKSDASLTELVTATVRSVRFTCSAFAHRVGFLICDPIVFGMPHSPETEDETEETTAADTFAVFLRERITDAGNTGLTALVLVAACDTWLELHGVQVETVPTDVGE